MPDVDTLPPAQGVLELETWELPPRRAPGLVAPVLAVENFEGPLDWLLELARARRIDLTRLSIADLIEAFSNALTAALEASDKAPLLLARWGDWVVMAAELTLLRSRLLLPADAAGAQTARDEAERLRRTLLGRAEMAQAADWLDTRAQVGREVFLRGVTEDSGAVRREQTGDITALLRACLAAIRLPADAAERCRVPTPPFWSVLDATRRIRELLPDLATEGGPFEAFLPNVPADVVEREWRCRVAVSATFLAGLELTRDGAATLGQDDAWQHIQVRGVLSPSGRHA